MYRICTELWSPPGSQDAGPFRSYEVKHPGKGVALAREFCFLAAFYAVQQYIHSTETSRYKFIITEQ